MLPLTKETLEAVDHVAYRCHDSSIVLSAYALAYAQGGHSEDPRLDIGSGGRQLLYLHTPNESNFFPTVNFIISLLTALTGHKFLLRKSTSGNYIYWQREDYCVPGTTTPVASLKREIKSPT